MTPGTFFCPALGITASIRIGSQSLSVFSFLRIYDSIVTLALLLLTTYEMKTDATASLTKLPRSTAAPADSKSSGAVRLGPIIIAYAMSRRSASVTTQ